MRLRSMIFVWLLIAMATAGLAHAAQPTAESAGASAPISNFTPMFTPVSFSLLPPPPPPPSCAATCLIRYRWCIDAGTNPSVCAGKYNYCIMNCSSPPILTIG